MRRFYCKEVLDNSVLTGEEHYHLAYVLRAKVGEHVLLCPQDGYDYEAVIEKIAKDFTELRVVEKKKNELEPTIRVDLFMSLLKGDKMDVVVQKATELGLNAVYPLMTKFVQVKPESVKIERLNKITAEAAKQCGRGLIPKVETTVLFKDMLKKLSGYDLVVFPYEKADAKDMRSFLKEAHEKLNELTGKSVAIIIGSEGGFSDEEVALLTEKGIMPVTLGKRILRAETACITVSAVVMYEMEQWL